MLALPYLVIVPLFVLIASTLVHAFYSHVRMRQFKNRTKRIVSALEKAYARVNPYQISQRARQQQQLACPALVYGEINLYALAELLLLVKANSHDIFYDLGSGDGKAVLLAALLFAFEKACGIEYLKPLWQVSLNMKQQLELHFNKKLAVAFSHADMFQSNISEASIVFVNATGLYDENWQAAVSTLKTLKPNTRIIITSKQLPNSDFLLITRGLWLMSWGMSSVYLYRKLR